MLRMRHDPAPATRRIQREFLDDLTGRRERAAAERARAFREPRRGGIEDRWHVYAHGYLTRTKEAMESEYAAVRWILGPEAFAAAIERYLAVFPPRSFDLANAGDRFQRFLEFDALSSELPFLPDLARLERMVAESFTAADARPISWEELRQLAPEDVAALRMQLAPGVFLLRSAWPLVELWACRLQEDDEAVSIELDGRPCRALVFRRDERVRVEELSETEAALVEAAGPLDSTLADLQELSGTLEEPASLAALLDAFHALVDRGVFVHRRSAGWTGALEIAKEDLS